MFKFKNVHLDDESMWPKEARIELEEPFVDDRGSIQHLVNFPMKNLSMIFSKKGSVRSNHSHFTDWHYMFAVYGSYEYHYRPYNSDEPLKLETFKEGEMVFTPPNEEHACLFLEDTLLVVVSRNPRGDQETYEKDVVRMQLIDPDNTGL
jgi:dTDP-4-dehydrorhamnose 3,5-epimerase-like enzyme